jgi:hypothetical protein
MVYLPSAQDGFERLFGHVALASIFSPGHQDFFRVFCTITSISRLKTLQQQIRPFNSLGLAAFLL